MTRDRITRLHVSGLRTLHDVTLDLRKLTVLIGENGTGKSSVLEALELLRQAAKPVAFVPDILVKAHGGLGSLLRRGANELRLEVTVEGAGPRLDYGFSIANVGTAPEVSGEYLDCPAASAPGKSPRPLTRSGKQARIFDAEKNEETVVTLGEQALAVASFGIAAPQAFQRLTAALGGIEVQVPFETRPLWQQRELEIRSGPRWPSLVEPVDRLARYAVNLAICFQQLRNLGEDVWARTRDRARLGLGEDFRDFQLIPFGRGSLELRLIFGGAPDKPLPVESLSEGQVAYLSFVALAALNEGRSLLAFDEPENHLHPALLSRVAWLFEEIAEEAPVVVATQSDRLLDALEKPEESIVLCELDSQRATRLRRPNAERLAEWLVDYRGLGTLRADGYEQHVFDDERPVSEAEVQSP